MNCKLLDDLLGCPVIWIVEHHLIWIGEQHSDHLRYVQTQKEEEVKENCLNVEKFWHFVLLIVQSILFHLFFFFIYFRLLTHLVNQFARLMKTIAERWNRSCREIFIFNFVFFCIFIMVSFRSVSHANLLWNVILFQLFVAIYIGAF